MATQVQVFRGGSWEDVDYSRFEVNIGISSRRVAPEAQFTTNAQESITAGQSARIRIDGSTIFAGTTASGGSKQGNGEMDVDIDHEVSELWSATAAVSLSTPSDEQVLTTALSNADTQASFTLDYAGSSTSLASDYDVENRSVLSIFRDMLDRTDRVFWVEPTSTTIHVEPAADRGLWQALDTESDRMVIDSFDSGSVETVRNDVTVIGTGGQAVEGTAEDATSISNYGRRSKTYNVSYALTQAEANALASSLIQPDPIPEGDIRVGSNVGDVTQSLVNQTIDLSSTPQDIDADGLLIETQTIEQGTATLTLGGGVGESVAAHNRDAKSRGDITAPGSVYGNDRIAEDAIDSEQLVDTAVIESKLDDLSVTETKIQDDSISTPKIQTEAITSQKILAGTIQALDIAAGTLTANEIDTLDLDASQIQVVDPISNEGVEFTVSGSTVIFEPTASGSGGIGSLNNRMGSSYFTVANIGTANIGQMAPDGTATGQGFEFGDVNLSNVYIRPTTDNRSFLGDSSKAFQDIWAYDFVDASTGSAINDGGDALNGLADGSGPPDHATRTDDAGDVVGLSLIDMAKSAWQVNREQQRVIERLEETVSELSKRIEQLETD